MDDKKEHSGKEQNRRDFLKIGAVAGLGAALAGISQSGCSAARKLTTSPVIMRNQPLTKVRMGFVNG